MNPAAIPELVEYQRTLDAFDSLRRANQYLRSQICFETEPREAHALFEARQIILNLLPKVLDAADGLLAAYEIKKLELMHGLPDDRDRSQIRDANQP